MSTRPESILNREEFGHWEADLVKGKKTADQPALLVMTERKTRFELLLKLPNFLADTCIGGITDLIHRVGYDCFKSISFDNGAEFSTMSALEHNDLKVYFCHAYSSWERGSNENQNKLLREYIPKGHSLANYSDDDIQSFEEALSSKHRKLLGYTSAEEIFEDSLVIL
ncbi:IS30 family transposase [Periweissella cryptocerci]|uniref:IS30 family transposase n=1 Tax=Periweissella cryptocerci TaxID=2506420 RepID=UPI001FAA3ADE|nr:IS30 family transposase [Periweissella cryptocerci]